jgi:hypothetical protein
MLNVRVQHAHSAAMIKQRPPPLSSRFDKSEHTCSRADYRVPY